MPPPSCMSWASPLTFLTCLSIPRISTCLTGSPWRQSWAEHGGWPMANATERQLISFSALLPTGIHFTNTPLCGRTLWRPMSAPAVCWLLNSCSLLQRTPPKGTASPGNDQKVAPADWYSYKSLAPLYVTGQLCAIVHLPELSVGSA